MVCIQPQIGTLQEHAYQGFSVHHMTMDLAEGMEGRQAHTQILASVILLR